MFAILVNGKEKVKATERLAVPEIELLASQDLVYLKKIMNQVVLLLGSNVGDRLVNLSVAMSEISRELGGITLQSDIYETAPWGNTKQSSFLNQVLVITSRLQSAELMEKIIQIEASMGRMRIQKWEPRIIDIDILFFNDEIISSENLTVPHPDLHLRKFALIPLAEILPHYIHPVLGKAVSVLLENVNDPLEVTKFSSNFA